MIKGYLQDFEVWVKDELLCEVKFIIWTIA